jgi:hypothetical protein
MIPQNDAFLEEAAMDKPNPIILKKISAELRVILLQAAEESGDRFARLPNEGSPPGHVDWNIVREQANRA